ncbi:MAG: pyrroline-5-carboxylate reductase [Dehalococcoidia bacterium]|nr:MAG: pyrroline-5-carboxylate reductase [Dehalococcoidia bacterium]
MKLVFVGGGTMAEAMLERLISGGIVAPEQVHVVDTSHARRELLQQQHRVATYETPSECICGAEVVVLAVKPQDLAKAAPQIGRLEDGQLLLSILAGTRLDRLVSYFGHPLIVRAMPNTPAQIGMGMTVWTATPDVPEALVDKARRILAVLGDELYVPDEKYVDMATALSGSGPAYVFLFVEALIDGAVGIGMPRPMAERLAVQTVRGSTEYLAKSGRHPAELRNLVTSPGGTTAAALHELEKGSLRALVAEAVAAAYARAKSLQS